MKRLARVSCVIAAGMITLSFMACGDDAAGPTCQQTDCDGVCVDTRVDSDNCGACGNACAVGQICDAGTCTTACTGGTTECGGACVDTQVDPDHCGGCDIACGTDEACDSGTCMLTCDAPTILCDGACIDPMTDLTYCGASGDCSGGTAGVTCGSGQTCESGVCTEVIDVTAANMVGEAYVLCDNTPPEYSAAPCGTAPEVGIQWTDTSGMTASAIAFTVYAFWNCNGSGDVPREVMFNGVDVGDILPAGEECVCAPTTVERTITVDSTAPFVPSGLNTITFPYLAGALDCESYGPNPAGGDTYGTIVIGY